MTGWIDAACDLGAADGAVVRASLIGVKGSAPREAGTMMLITRTGIWHTIGGGTLEFDIMKRARKLIAATPEMWTRQTVSAALGPDMGQCCGGQVKVLLEHFGAAELAILADYRDPVLLRHPLASGEPVIPAAPDDQPGISAERDAWIAPVGRPRRPVFLYGAGHIGRALAPHLIALECDLHWVDVAEDRFPTDMPADLHRVIASDPTVIARHAPADAIHLVITHDHALDEAICHQVLTGSGFARLGLIGSGTKAARFRSRLAKAGVGPAQIERLHCPLGLDAIGGKHPARVALSIAAGVAIWQQELDE